LVTVRTGVAGDPPEDATSVRRRRRDVLQLVRLANAPAGLAVCRGTGAASGEPAWNDVVRRRTKRPAIPSLAESAGRCVVVGIDPNAPVPGSSREGGAVIAVVGTALGALPPAPPNAGSRGAEKRDDVDSREAREPGRSGEG
jgi:hypothetical protein